MTYKIEELAYKAEEKADALVDLGYEFHTAYTKIFAQLLVNDICDILSKLHDQAKDSHNYYAYARNKIQECYMHDEGDGQG